jgi:Reverse transcriptase (RNA-dependent DNA polymerase)
MTLKNKYLILVIDDLLDEFHGAIIFFEINLRYGYHQIRMHYADIENIVFKTHKEHFEYIIISFGLTNVSATFQALMNQVFKSFLEKIMLMFFDNILINNLNLITHSQHLTKVLQKLKENELYAKLSKYEFDVPRI